MNTDTDPYAESIDPRVHCDACEAVCCRLTVVLMPDDHVPAWLVHRDAHGMEGQFQAQAGVYGREKEACRVCGAAIRRITQGGRSTFYCPKCQR